MKIVIQKSNREQGSVLFVSLAICAILGILIGSYLYLIQTQRLSVTRGQAWESALTIAEAGVEEAMAHLNSGIGTNSFGTNSWTDLGGGNYGKTNYLGSNYWAVTIRTSPAVTNAYPVILSTGYVPGPISGPTLSRTILVNTRQKVSSGTNAAIITTSTIDLSGSGVTVDSFDSSDPNYSTLGQYDPNKRLDNGNIIATSTATNAVSVGDSVVYGTIHTAPGGIVVVDTKNNATDSVGDLGWVNGGNIGIESGHAMQDAAYNFTDVTLPGGVTWVAPPNKAQYKFTPPGGSQVNFDYTLTSGGTYVITNLGSSVYVGLLGGVPSPGLNVTVYVPNSFSIPSGNAIYIAPGASLTMYVAAASASIAGQGVVNATGLAKDFVYYGLPSNTSFGVQANANFIGQVVAPEAFVSIGGGGSTTNDFSGQIIAQSVKLNGHMKVHYDQSLGGPQTPGGYAASFWTEL